MAEAARIGGTCLAGAIVVSSPTPEIVLALLGVAFLVVGGTAWNGSQPIAIRLAVLLLSVILARVFAGTAAAAMAALLVVAGAWLRVGVAEATAGLAVFGLAVALLGGASARVVAAFGLLGLVILVIRSVAAGVGRRLRGRSLLTAERASTAPLRPEN